MSMDAHGRALIDVMQKYSITHAVVTLPVGDVTNVYEKKNLADC